MGPSNFRNCVRTELFKRTHFTNAEFEKQLPSIIADRIASLIVKSGNVEDVKDLLLKDLTPNTLMGDFKEFLRIITPEERVGRRVQQLVCPCDIVCDSDGVLPLAEGRPNQ